MAGLLGFLAGAGMMVLIGVLVLAFCRQMAWITADTARKIGKTFAFSALCGVCYLLFAALVRQVMQQNVESAADYSGILQSAYLNRVYAAVENPQWMGFATGVFIYAAHALGTLMLGQYLPAALALSFCMTGAACCLIQCRCEKCFGESFAKSMVFLILCLPGAVYSFLPGCAAVYLLVFSILFHVFGKRIPQKQPKPVPVMVHVLLLLASAAVTAALAMGRMG